LRQEYYLFSFACFSFYLVFLVFVLNFSPGWSSEESEVSSVCQHSDVSSGTNPVKGSGVPGVVYRNFDGSQQTTADGNSISFPETSSLSEVGLVSPEYLDTR